MNLFGSPNIDRMIADRDYDGLYRCLEHSNWQVRLLAAQALADMQDGAGWRVLMDSVRKADDPEAQRTAAAMLGELGHPRAVPVLGEMLKKSRLGLAQANPDVITALRDALEMIGGREAEDALRAAGYTAQAITGSALSASGASLGPDEFLGGYERPVLPSTDTIQFFTAEQHLNTAAELREAEQAERGLVECGLALWLNPEWAYAWYLRGVLMEDLERLFEAVLAYRRAVEIDPTLADAREALAELEQTETAPPLDRDVLLSSLSSRGWRERRDAAAGLGELADPASVPALIEHLDDEEREVRHAAVEALGEIAAHALEEAAAAQPALLQRGESSWLLRFAIIEALSSSGSAANVAEALRREMNRIQERNTIFTSRKDPLLEVEYDRLLEIGVLALERTGDLSELLELAEGNVWEEIEDWQDDDETGIQLDEDMEVAGELEEDIELDEDLTSYVDEVAQMVSYALERLAVAHLAELDHATLQRLSLVPDLTLLDVSSEQEQFEPTVVHDLSALRRAAKDELRKRTIT